MKDYIGKVCWQARGYSSIRFGVVIDQKMEDKWLMFKVSWDNCIEESWEKCLNVSFTIPDRKI
tara:strand:- start:210 stop:398 length:189 start_codon:yes stop_codon:yes gene_type:complete